jgi:hypothetical protein
MTLNTILRPPYDLVGTWAGEAPGTFDVPVETLCYIATLAANWGAEQYEKNLLKQANGNG